MRLRVWEVPEPVPPSAHGFKYSCLYGRPGERVVLYGNERGKGDHRNYGEREEPYAFRGVESLIAVEDAGHRFVDAWKRMEGGEAVREHHVSFEDWTTMVRVLSPKRLALLRHVHAFPAKNVRKLAQALGRDYRRVHDDVSVLAAAGLLERDADGLRADYGAFELRMNVAL